MSEHETTLTAVTASPPIEASPRLLPHAMVSRVIRRRGVRQFVKFGIVGLSGLLVNLVLFTILQGLMRTKAAQEAHYSLDYSIAFLSGGVSNYFLNRIWTFRSSGHAVKQGFQFIGISLVALLVAIGISKLLIPIAFFGPGHKTWFVMTFSAILVNFFANKYWTFREA